MNWRRGLWRAWLALSVSWAIFAIWMRYSIDARLPDPPPGFYIVGGLRDWTFWLLYVLAPPVSVAALWLAGSWVVAGFRKSD